MSVYFYQPSEFNTYHDIEAVYDCLKSEYNIKQEDIILYGQSVGSGPTLHLASRLQRLRAVVLHSAILSGIRVLYPVKMTFWFDIFKVSMFFSARLIVTTHHADKSSFILQNIDKIQKVSCPVLVIHVRNIYFASFFFLLYTFTYIFFRC